MPRQLPQKEWDITGCYCTVLDGRWDEPLKDASSLMERDVEVYQKS